jgi:hypothetical protein
MNNMRDPVLTIKNEGLELLSFEPPLLELAGLRPARL